MTSTAQNPESVGCQNGAFVVSQNLGTFLKEMASNISSDKACKRKSLLLVLTIFGRTKGAQIWPVYSHRWEIPDIGALSWESCTLRGVDQTRARSVSPPPFNSLLFLPLPSLPLFSTPSSLSSFPPPFLIDETQPPLKGVKQIWGWRVHPEWRGHRWRLVLQSKQMPVLRIKWLKQGSSRDRRLWWERRNQWPRKRRGFLSGHILQVLWTGFGLGDIEEHLE